MFTSARLLLAAISLLTLPLHPEVKKLNQIKELPAHIETFIAPHKGKKVLIAWDIDHTTIRSTCHVGSDHWFGDLVKRCVAKGDTFEEAVKKVKPHYYAAQDAITVVPVEPETVAIISALQDKHPTIAITKRSPGIADRTRIQLLSHKIDFTKTAPHAKPFEFHVCDDGKFVDGHLLCANNHKHDALEKFCEITSTTVEVFIMVDDRCDYLDKLNEHCAKKGIQYLGVHYTHLEDWAKEYDYEKTRAEYTKLTGKSYDF